MTRLIISRSSSLQVRSVNRYVCGCKIDYRRLFALAPWFYAASLALSTAVLFFGSEYNGSKRWLKLGPLSFQPSEFAKMAVILFLPWVMEHTKGRSDSLWFMTKAVLCTLPIAALVGSNNLSTAIIFARNLCISDLLFHIRATCRFSESEAPASGLLPFFLMMESYRLERLAIWRNPEAYEKGFQTIQGLYAIGSGRIFGCGLGKGLQKLGFVPEAQNDMIFRLSVRRADCSALPGDRRVAVLIWRFDGYFDPCAGSWRSTDCGRNYGAYCASGDSEHRGCDKYDSEYRHYAAFYQLRRHLRVVSARRDGACPVGLEGHRLKRRKSAAEREQNGSVMHTVKREAGWERTGGSISDSRRKAALRNGNSPGFQNAVLPMIAAAV